MGDDFITGGPSRGVLAGGTYNVGDPRINGMTISGPTTFRLGNATGPNIHSAYSMPSSSLVAGWDSTARQQYVDQATTNAKNQIGNQLGAAARQAAMQGRRFISTPAQQIQGAAQVAAAGTQAGWNADQESFNRRMQMANLNNQDRQFNLQAAGQYNQAALGYGGLANQSRGMDMQQAAYNQSLNNQRQQAQGFNQGNQAQISQYGGQMTSANPYGLTNYNPGRGAGNSLGVNSGFGGGNISGSMGNGGASFGSSGVTQGSSSDGTTNWNDYAGQ